jgi:mono/diheme cytochrome c family protein
MTAHLSALRWVAGTAFGVAVFASPASAQNRGELLYSTHCGACHTAQMHWRANRAVTDWASLKAEVRKWQIVASLGWSEDDVLDVARYLNDSIYHFEPMNSTSSSTRSYEERCGLPLNRRIVSDRSC